MEFNEETFYEMVDDLGIWTPVHGDHKHWITTLVCNLINSTAVHDEMLRLLIPVCKVKVNNYPK